MNPDIPLYNQDGAKRKAGFELEFSGIELQKAADIVQSVFGGEISKKHRYLYTVSDTPYGTFRVELDAKNMRRMANENAFKKWGIDFDKDDTTISVEDIVDRLAQSVVPLEIVAPPIPLDEIEKLESLRAELQEQNALGTKKSLMYAFGVHINIECPSLEARSLLNHLQAFILLYPWLVEKLKIDLTRKVTPFVDQFPEKYGLMIVEPSYQPGKRQLIDDYLMHNPTRNRPLDMMPVWALDEPEKVEAVLEDEKNEPRPTFHYRMPNSRIDDPYWRLTDELDYWMEVEKLVAKPEMLDKLCQLYLLQKERSMIPFRSHWINTVQILLDLDE